MTNTPAGWHPDPEDPSQLRYWDGNAWTEHRSPAGPGVPGGYASAPQSSGKATTALVLGVVSLVACGIFTGIPAMILGKQAAREIDAQSQVGEVYLRSLLRAQLRLGLTVLLLLAVLVGGLPLAFWLLPDLMSTRLLGMPLAWGLLGFVVYPVLVLLGWWYVRSAERNEDDFTEVLER